MFSSSTCQTYTSSSENEYGGAEILLTGAERHFHQGFQSGECLTLLPTAALSS